MRHAPPELPIPLDASEIARFLAGATVLRLPVRCGLSLVDGRKIGMRAWASIDLGSAVVDGSYLRPVPAGMARPDPYGRRVRCRFSPGCRLWVRETPSMARSDSSIDLNVTGAHPARLSSAGDPDVALEGFETAQDMIRAFRDRHGGRFDVDDPWTWEIAVTVRSSRCAP